MTDVAGAAPNQALGGKRASVGEMLRSTEIDLRLFGMVVALVLIWIGLGLANPVILEPVNFLTFSVQAASTAVLATGMVLVILSRHNDLSVGSGGHDQDHAGRQDGRGRRPPPGREGGGRHDAR